MLNPGEKLVLAGFFKLQDSLGSMSYPPNLPAKWHDELADTNLFLHAEDSSHDPGYIVAQSPFLCISTYHHLRCDQLSFHTGPRKCSAIFQYIVSQKSLDKSSVSFYQHTMLLQGLTSQMPFAKVATESLGRLL